MPDNYLIFPMLAMVLLTATILGLLFRRRVLAIRNEEVSAGFYQTYQGQTESDDALKLSRHFSNLFEAPVLFYAVCISALATGLVTDVLQLLARGYVAARIIHANVHVGKNKLPLRIAAYFSSWSILVAMWVYLAILVVV